MRFIRLAAGAALLSTAAAQTHTACQPLNRTDCPPDPAFGTSHYFNFNTTPSIDLWETTAGKVEYNSGTGAAFSVKKQGDSPTIRSKFYIFWGRYEISLKVAPGTGIISSVMLLSDDLDEIDIEFMGANDTQVTTNIFAKGDVDDHSYGKEHVMSGGTQDDYHTYVVDWTKERLEWSVDNVTLRTLTFAEAKNGDKFPQTPMRMSIGIWAGGDPNNPKGTIEWAGGPTDYGKGPYTMFVKGVMLEDYTKGSKEYSYGDKSGTYQSIQVKQGNSTAYENLHKVPPMSIAERWAALAPGARIAVYSAAGAVAAIALAALGFYYIRQRRIGVKEARLADEKAKAERLELEQFRQNGVNPDGFREHGQEYGEKNLTMTPPRAGGNPFTHPDDSRPGSRHRQAPDMALAGGAATGFGAASPAGSRSPSSPPSAPNAQYSQTRQTPNSPSIAHAGFDFGIPPSPSNASFNDAHRPQQAQSPVSQMRSATADPYRGNGSPGPQQGYGLDRMQSPMGQPGSGVPGSSRQSPGPMRPQQQGSPQQRQQSPGPGYGGGRQPAYRGGGNTWN